MMTLYQILLAAKIEYHWWRIKSIRKKKTNTSQRRYIKLSVTENLHRFKAENASILYEISLGVRAH